MKFSHYLEPDSLDFLTLRARIKAGGCPHCHSPDTLVAHGYLRAGSGDITKGMRYFCSNRYSNQGCGRTFSVHWDTFIPHCSLPTERILALIRAVAKGPSTHAAWFSSGLSISLGSAYRWVAKWHNLTAHIRTGLCRILAPPGKIDGQPDPFTLNHLAAAFPQATCCIAAFQFELQMSITG